MKRRALFLDRDGVINVDHNYVHRREDFEFIDGIFELVNAAKNAGYLIIVVTNQAGIGRGYYTEAAFQDLMDWVRERFEAQGGGVDAIYFCPFHIDGIGAYKRDSEFRKPKPGMFLQAGREHDIDMARSIMIGDKPSDAQAGAAAGVGTLLFFGEEGDAGPATRIDKLKDAIAYL